MEIESWKNICYITPSINSPGALQIPAICGRRELAMDTLVTFLLTPTTEMIIRSTTIQKHQRRGNYFLIQLARVSLPIPTPGPVWQLNRKCIILHQRTPEITEAKSFLSLQLRWWIYFCAAAGVTLCWDVGKANTQARGGAASVQPCQNVSPFRGLLLDTWIVIVPVSSYPFEFYVLSCCWLWCAATQLPLIESSRCNRCLFGRTSTLHPSIYSNLFRDLLKPEDTAMLRKYLLGSSVMLLNVYILTATDYN